VKVLNIFTFRFLNKIPIRSHQKLQKKKKKKKKKNKKKKDLFPYMDGLGILVVSMGISSNGSFARLIDLLYGLYGLFFFEI